MKNLINFLVFGKYYLNIRFEIFKFILIFLFPSEYFLTFEKQYNLYFKRHTGQFLKLTNEFVIYYIQNKHISINGKLFYRILLSLMNAKIVQKRNWRYLGLQCPCLSFTLILQIAYLLAEDINYEIHFMVQNKIYDNRDLLE